MVERIEDIGTFKQPDYIKAEIEAHDYLVEHGFTPQGVDEGFKTVCVFKFEHPEFKDNPVKRGKCDIYHFKNWQEAKEKLCN